MRIKIPLSEEQAHWFRSLRGRYKSTLHTDTDGVSLILEEVKNDRKEERPSDRIQDRKDGRRHKT